MYRVCPLASYPAVKTFFAWTAGYEATIIICAAYIAKSAEQVMCEQCLPQFYQDPTLLLDNPNICIGRSMAGVVSQNCMGKNHSVTENSFSKLYSTVVLKGVARIY